MAAFTKVLVVVFFAMIGAGLWLVSTYDLPNSQKNALVFYPKNVELRVSAGDSTPFELKATNRHPVPVYIDRIFGSCRCAELNASSESVPPNGVLVVSGSINHDKIELDKTLVQVSVVYSLKRGKTGDHGAVSNIVLEL